MKMKFLASVNSWSYPVLLVYAIYAWRWGFSPTQTNCLV